MHDPFEAFSRKALETVGQSDGQPSPEVKETAEAAPVMSIPWSARKTLLFDDSCHIVGFEPEERYDVPVDLPEGRYHFCNLGEEMFVVQKLSVKTLNDLLEFISGHWDELTAGDGYEHPYLEQVVLAVSGRRKYIDCCFGS